MAKAKGRAAVERKAQALSRLEVRYASINAIVANTYNPNRQSEHDFELLTRSMREDGFTQPVVAVDAPDQPGKYVIVDGEHRWRAARDLGYEEIPLVVVPMTPEQARIATLRHNRARGSEDAQLAADVLKDLQQLGALDWAQASLMLDDVEVNALLNDLDAPAALAGEQFTQAWEPEKALEETSSTVRVSQRQDRVEVAAESRAAVLQAKERIERLGRARTSDERDQIRSEVAAPTRIAVLYDGEDARVVRQVLGDEPAERLLELCRKRAPVAA